MRRPPCLFLSLFLAASPCLASISLDDFLSALETNGVLADRSHAVRGGLEGILRSVDPEAVLGTESVAEADQADRPAVESVELWPEDLAYIKGGTLKPGGGAEIMAHLRALGDKAGLILDLRGMGGDDLPSLSLLAGLGREDGTPLFVVTDNQDKPLSTNSVETAVSINAPLMVLVDGDTRDAAEALAVLWKGHQGIMLMGTETRGNLRFREPLTLPDGQRVAVATRKLTLPGGRVCNGGGLHPDVVVKSEASSVNAMLSSTNPSARALSVKAEGDLELMARVEGDITLRRATDILLGLRLLGGYGKR
jgi:C-terminal processing protease CtpA/Prc